MQNQLSLPLTLLQNNLAMTIKPGTAAEANLSFTRVQSLRNIHDNVISAKAGCSGDLDVVKGLVDLLEPDQYQGMQSHIAKLRGYIESSDVLQSRIRNAIDLVRADAHAASLWSFGALTCLSLDMLSICKISTKQP